MPQVGLCNFPLVLFVIPPFSLPNLSLPIPNFVFSFDLECPLND